MLPECGRRVSTFHMQRELPDNAKNRSPKKNENKFHEIHKAKYL